MKHKEGQSFVIDTSFDFRSDANGKDPDHASPTLRSYHQVLWSRPLPSGSVFELTTTRDGEYLYHRSDLGEFFLSSDSVIPTYEYYVRLQHIIERLDPGEVESFIALGYTMGGMMIFPSNKIGGGWTINQARGCMSRTIGDRMDLTLECIRRHYLGQASPMSEVLARYRTFFELFRDFGGYVEFFILQDLARGEDSPVKTFLPFDNFESPAIPTSVAMYHAYREQTMDFIHARNRSIGALGL